MEPTQTTSPERVVTGMFWSRNLFSVTPVILRLDGETLTLKTKTETVLQVPISQVACRFTLFGTMLIQTSQKRYRFYAIGNSANETFSKEQLEEIDEAQGQQHAIADMAYSVAGGVGRTGTGLGAVGDAIALATYGKATDDNVSVWKRAFEAHYVLVPSKIKLRPSVVIAIMVALTIVITLVVIFTAPK